MSGSVFERVLSDFKTQLRPDEEKGFQGTKIEDLRLTIASIQQKQISSRTNQNLTRLRPFLEAIQSYAHVVDLFVNVNDFVAFIWGPIRFLLQVANAYSDAFSTLLEIYETIGRQMPLLAQYEKLFDRSHDMAEALEQMFQSIFDFHRRALRFFQAGRWERLFKIHVFKAKFSDIIDGLRQHKELVDKQAHLVEFQEAKEARLLAQQNYQRLLETERLHRKLLLEGWLDAPNMPQQQEKCQAVREDRPESGRWLLTRDKYRAWFDSTINAPACLWIHGIPGAGKTVLGSLIVDECAAVRSRQTIYFYCQHGDPRRDNFVSMARSLLDQLAAENDSVVDILYDSATQIDTPFKTRRATETLLKTCLDLAGPLYIILDGLDECLEAERKAIAKWLRIYADNSGKTREPSCCVFLSQDDASTKALLGTLPVIQIKPKDNHADIKAYCSIRAKELQNKFALSHTDTAFVVEAVCSRAEGMFLYARLVMDNLLGQTDLSSMKAEMDPGVFPHRLDQAYHRIVVRILDDAIPAYRSGAQKILAWTVCAARPLQWREIQCAVSVDADGEKFDPDKRIVLEPKELCGSLVDIQADGSLQLVHTTAKHYLTSSRVVLEQLEHVKLSQLCLEQFCLPAFDERLGEDRLTAHIISGDFAFFDYSILHWIFHLDAHLNAADLVPGQRLAGHDPEDFAQTIRGFLDIHYLRPMKKLRPTSKLARMVGGNLQLEDDYSKQLNEAIAASICLSNSEVQNPLSYEALALYQILRRTRTIVEDLAADPASRPVIEKFYGASPFKCSRMHCKSFTQGFATKTQRDDHVAKHERAHYCPYFGCAHATLGCATANELEAHMQAFHRPPLTDQDFPPDSIASGIHQRTLLPATPGPAGSNVQPIAISTQGGQALPSSTTDLTRTGRLRHSGPVTCNECQKSFSRVSHLRSHQRIHSKERPYVCSRCRRSFARNTDLTRHKKLHTDTKQYECGGTVGIGDTWGCGRKFMRADHLVRHFKGVAGKLCWESLANANRKMGQTNVNVPGSNLTSRTGSPAQPVIVPAAGSHSALPLRSNASTYMLPQTSSPATNSPTMPHYGDDLLAILYQDHPELADLDWDGIPPEALP